MSTQTQATSNHEEIKKWAEKRNAKPVKVKGTEQNGSALLRLDFPDYSGENLQEISWKEWFDIFDKNNLALIYQKETAGGQTNNFNKIVSKENTKNL